MGMFMWFGEACNTDKENPSFIDKFRVVFLFFVWFCFLNSKPVYPQVPAERLGCHPQTGFSDIQSHPFFRAIDWMQLEEKQIIPPYKPHIRHERDLEHFDPAFTNEPVRLTPDDP